MERDSATIWRPAVREEAGIACRVDDLRGCRTVEREEVEPHTGRGLAEEDKLAPIGRAPVDLLGGHADVEGAGIARRRCDDRDRSSARYVRGDGQRPPVW